MRNIGLMQLSYTAVRRGVVRLWCVWNQIWPIHYCTVN